MNSLVVYFVVSMASFVAMMVDRLGGGRRLITFSESGFNLAVGIWMAVTVVLGVSASISRNTSKRRLESCDYRLCTHCLYELDPSLPKGNCPECGTAYSLEGTKAQWLARYRDPSEGRLQG